MKIENCNAMITGGASLACHIAENSYLNDEFNRLDGALRMGFGRK